MVARSSMTWPTKPRTGSTRQNGLLKRRSVTWAGACPTGSVRFLDKHYAKAVHILFKLVANAELVKCANIFYDGQTQAGAIGVAAFVKPFKNSFLVERAGIACIFKTKLIPG